MNRVLLTGELKEVEDGAARRDGTPWQRAVLVVDGSSQYPQKIPVFLWDPDKRGCRLRQGETVLLEAELRSKGTPKKDGNGEWLNITVAIASCETLATPRDLEPQQGSNHGNGGSYDGDDQGGLDDDLPF